MHVCDVLGVVQMVSTNTDGGISCVCEGCIGQMCECVCVWICVWWGDAGGG